MPARAVRNAPFYEERLGVPWHWWLLGAGVVGLAAAEILVGVDPAIALVVLGAVTVLVVAFLVRVGRVTVRVDAEGLHAGGRTLPTEHIASATALDGLATRDRLGPGGDPGAVVVARGYVRTAVLVRTSGADPVPYWLVSSRHPERLAAALGRAGAVTP